MQKGKIGKFAQMSQAEVLNKVDILLDTLKCAICNNVFDDPVVFSVCGDTFCRTCAVDYFGKTCPKCDEPVEETDALKDKQMAEFIPLVKQLKILLCVKSVAQEEVTEMEKTEAEENKDEKIEYHEGRVNGIEKERNRESDDDKMEVSMIEGTVPEETPKRVPQHALRLRKSTISKDLNCEDTPKNNGALLKPRRNSAMLTPKKFILAKRSVTSPSYKLAKRMCYSPFSPKKKAHVYKLLSPLNIERKNVKGETVLHAAVIRGNVERVTSLLEKKANPNVKDNAGWTPLHEASNHGFFEITKLLVEYGAVIDEPGQDSITPLHDAVQSSHMHIANYLASKGGNVYAVTAQNFNALDLCRNKAAMECLENSYNSSAVSVSDISNIDKSTEEKEEQLVFICTSLDDKQKKLLEECAKMLKAEVMDEFNPDVTHIVTSCDNNGQCNRTLKILYGILAGKWIVNAKWLESCLKQKKKVSEEAFEVPGTKQLPDTYGPQLARINLAKKQPGLFSGCSFYIYGSINPPSPPKENICQLIQLGGGKVLLREPRPETVEKEDFVMPFHAKETSLSEASHFILYQDKPPRGQEMQGNHIFTMTIRWFIESISAFKLLDPGAKK